MAKLLYFRGEGKGFMSGVSEYIVLQDSPCPSDDHAAHGFKLYKSYEVDIEDGDWPCELPTDEILVKK